MVPYPKVDARTAAVLVNQARLLLRRHVPDLQTRDEAGQLSDALISIFSRYGELLIARLNRAPEKYLFAFLDLIGISLSAPQAARVPLTFYLAPGTLNFAIVPAGTQVAAELAKGEQKQVIYETERELIVAPVRLQSLFLKDGGRDRYIQWDSALGPSTPPTAQNSPLPAAVRELKPIPHILYIGLKPSRPWPAINQLRLRFRLDEKAGGEPDKRTLQWEMSTGPKATAGSAIPTAPSEKIGPPNAPADTTVLAPFLDVTNDLTKTGEVVFLNVHYPPLTLLEGTTAHWFACRLLTAITRASDRAAGMVRETQLPQVQSVTAEISFERKGLVIEQAFANNQKVDVSKDFFPFGEKPKFGDTFYISSEEAFSNPDGFVTLHFTLTNPTSAGATAPIAPVDARDTKLAWEYWDGEAWRALGTGEAGAVGFRRRVRFVREEAPVGTQFSDTTQALSESGDVSFRFDKPPAQLSLNAQKGYWIRVRITDGNYGRDAQYERDIQSGGYMVTPPSFAPPSIHAVQIDYSVKNETPPEAVITCNDFTFTPVRPEGQAFRPFHATSSDDALPVLCMGFTPPSPPASSAAATVSSEEGSALKKGFPNRSMSIYFGLGESVLTGTGKVQSVPGSKVPVWEYWNGSIWHPWTVRDDTEGFRKSGLIRVLPPPDARMKKEFGVERYWLRMRQSSPDFDPSIGRVLLNTTTAREGSTVLGEVLGASNGQPGQRFLTTQSPVLNGQQLEIREPILPPVHEQAKIKSEEGEDAIGVVERFGGREEVWVRWHEVINFYGSGPRDRHYVVDRLRGEVLFGDGENGQVPPPLPNNIRLRSYRTGGGAAGNKPALAIKQMKTAVPYIDKVVNWKAADGGADGETESAIVERGSRTLRHGHRAVTKEDFQDLARLASFEVARARCVPLFDLEQDPDTNQRRPGTVSLIVVPKSAEGAPMPSSELCERVREFLDKSALPLLKLVVVGPEYVEADVEAVLAVEDIDRANEVELATILVLQRYLHPLTGGPAGTGWGFGRMPQKSDLYRVLEEIDGVSHVRSLQLTPRPLRTGVEKTERFLICCGKHRISIVPEEA
jgi:hypothetical protein